MWAIFPRVGLDVDRGPPVGAPWSTVTSVRGFNLQIFLCSTVNINVTKPSDFAFDQALCHKVNITEMHFAPTQPYYPSTICPSVTPHSSTFPPRHLLFSKAPPQCSTPPIPLSPRSPSRFLSPTLPFLSIHTTESLLIICDLLKYIHCYSLSHSHSHSLCLSFSARSSVQQPPCITHTLSLSLSEHFQCLLSFCSAG